MSRNIVKTLDRKFSDIEAGEKMLISSPEKIIEYICSIPEGSSKTIIQMRFELAEQMKADNTCPVSTGIFLRIAVAEKNHEIPYWRLIDENHPLVAKLELDPEYIKRLRKKEKIA